MTAQESPEVRWQAYEVRSSRLPHIAGYTRSETACGRPPDERQRERQPRAGAVSASSHAGWSLSQSRGSASLSVAGKADALLPAPHPDPVAPGS